MPLYPIAVYNSGLSNRGWLLQYTVMNTKATLVQKAILAAKQGNWEEAVHHNAAILEIEAKNTGALNRLGVAYQQLGDTKLAKKQFEMALLVDKTDKIAKKHLDKIKNNISIASPTFVQQHFIEEPGKTKTVELHRLAGKEVLQAISVGMSCELLIKNRYISVQTNGKYVGSLPEDLSFRLTRLITTGNTYSCAIRSCDQKNCEVYLREESRSKENHDIHSFPPNKIANNGSSDDIDERFVFEDEIPVQLTNMDSDFEPIIEDFDSDEDDE